MSQQPIRSRRLQLRSRPKGSGTSCMLEMPCWYSSILTLGEKSCFLQRIVDLLASGAGLQVWCDLAVPRRWAEFLRGWSRGNALRRMSTRQGQVSLAFWHGDGGGIQARKDLVGGDMQRMRRMANGSLGRVLSVGPDVATTYGSEQADKGI